MNANLKIVDCVNDSRLNIKENKSKLRPEMLTKYSIKKNIVLNIVILITVFFYIKKQNKM